MKFIRNNSKLIISLFISLFVILCALSFCFITIDIKEVAGIIASANYLYIIPVIILYFVWIYIRALRLKYMFNNVDNVRISNLYIAELIGYMANNLLPMRTGEIVRCAYICKKQINIKFATSVAVLLIERFIEAIVLIILGLIAISILVYYDLFINLNATYIKLFVYLISFILIIGVILLIITIFLIKKRIILDYIFKISSFIFRKYARYVNNMINSFAVGLKTLNSIKKLINIFIISIMIWLLEVFMYIIVAYSFGLDIYFTSFYIFFTAMLAVMMISNLFGAIPSSIGSIGVFEIVAQQVLISFGVDSAIAISYSVVLHILVFMLPVNIVGLFVLWMDNLSFSNFKQLSKKFNLIDREYC